MGKSSAWIKEKTAPLWTVNSWGGLWRVIQVIDRVLPVMAFLGFFIRILYFKWKSATWLNRQEDNFPLDFLQGQEYFQVTDFHLSPINFTT